MHHTDKPKRPEPPLERRHRQTYNRKRAEGTPLAPVQGKKDIRTDP